MCISYFANLASKRGRSSMRRLWWGQILGRGHHWGFLCWMLTKITLFPPASRNGVNGICKRVNVFKPLSTKKAALMWGQGSSWPSLWLGQTPALVSVCWGGYPVLNRQQNLLSKQNAEGWMRFQIPRGRQAAPHVCEAINSYKPSLTPVSGVWLLQVDRIKWICSSFLPPPPSILPAFYLRLKLRIPLHLAGGSPLQLPFWNEVRNLIITLFVSLSS